MFAPGIAHPSGRQWPLVRTFFLKKSEARSEEPRITRLRRGYGGQARMARIYLTMQRDAIGGCQSNGQMLKPKPRIAWMAVSMTKSARSAANFLPRSPNFPEGKGKGDK
jgi:hypothetical protein